MVKYHPYGPPEPASTGRPRSFYLIVVFVTIAVLLIGAKVTGLF